MGQKASKKKAALMAESNASNASDIAQNVSSTTQQISSSDAVVAPRKSKRSDSKRSSKKHRHNNTSSSNAPDSKKTTSADNKRSSSSNAVQSSTQRQASWSEDKVEKLFDEYERLNKSSAQEGDSDDELAVDPADDTTATDGGDEDEVAIGPNGIAALFNACGIDAESDEITLVFAQHCAATRLGFFSKAEFTAGMRALHCSSLPELKDALAQLRRKFEASGPDRPLMTFVFDLARTGSDVKTIDPMLASGLAALLLRRTPLGPRLATFLSEQTNYRGINADQWLGIWEFARSVDAQLTGYDEDGAWPIIIDDFVEWCKKE